MSTFGSTPDSGSGTDGRADADPATSSRDEPHEDAPPTEPSPDASEVEGEDAAEG